MGKIKNKKYSIDYDRNGYYVLSMHEHSKKRVLGMSTSPSELLNTGYKEHGISGHIVVGEAVSLILEWEQEAEIAKINKESSDIFNKILDQLGFTKPKDDWEE